MRRHPPDRELRSWAAAERDDLTVHIERCRECQASLESITHLGPRLRRALGHLMDPSRGFLDRLEERLDQRRSEAEAWDALADLFSLPWRVLEVVVDHDRN